VLDQHAELDFCSAISLKQQSADRHVAPFGHVILIPSQPVFALSFYWCVLRRKTTHTNFIVLGLISSGLEHRSPTLEGTTIIIAPPMRLVLCQTYLSKGWTNGLFFVCAFVRGVFFSFYLANDYQCCNIPLSLDTRKYILKHISKRPIKDEQIMYPNRQFQPSHTPDKKMTGL
jgi:hypothetical protein